MSFFLRIFVLEFKTMSKESLILLLNELKQEFQQAIVDKDSLKVRRLYKCLEIVKDLLLRDYGKVF